MTQACKSIDAPVPAAAREKTLSVLYVIDVLWGIAGAEAALLRNVRLLPKHGVRCSIATFRLRPGPELVEQFGCPIHEFAVSGMFTPRACRATLELSRLVRRERVDIVHTFFEAADLLGGLAARIGGAPVLVSSRRDMGILRSPRHRVAYRFLRPLFNQVQAVSESVRSHAIAAEGLDPAKTVVVGNGIELDTLDAADEAGARYLLDSLSIPPGAPVITAVSHIRRVKGIDLLLHAAKEVCLVYPKAVFLILGGIHEPAYMHELEKLSDDLGLTANVRFLGKQPQSRVWGILKQSDVFCLLSRSEGMSNALLEAMGCRVPCVATAAGGTPEVIADGHSGYLAPVGNTAAAAQRIIELLSNPTLARRIGSAGRALVAERFSAERVVENTARLYKQLLNSHGRLRRIWQH